MQRCSRVLQVAILVLGIGMFGAVGTPLPAAAASCQFVLGFQTLHALIPVIVGSCLVDEHHNPVSGDALQETTGPTGAGGLLVWRKADNWTAFTDGYRTWINTGPCVALRLNSQRFAFEANPDNLPIVPATCITGNSLPPVASNYTPVEIQQAISQVLGGPHGALPPIQLGPCSGGTGATTVSLVNQSQYAATVFLAGPVTQASTIAPGATADVQLPIGTYQVAVRTSYPGVPASAGQWDLGSNCRYEEQISLPATPTPTPQVATGALRVANQTGQPVTVTIAGPVRDQWQVPANQTVDHPVPVGTYQMTTQAWCGSSTATVTVAAGKLLASSFDCRPSGA